MTPLDAAGQPDYAWADPNPDPAKGGEMCRGAAPNRFELALAVTIATFGIRHWVAFAPVLNGCVNAALWIDRKCFGDKSDSIDTCRTNES